MTHCFRQPPRTWCARCRRCLALSRPCSRTPRLQHRHLSARTHPLAESCPKPGSVQSSADGSSHHRDNCNNKHALVVESDLKNASTHCSNPNRDTPLRSRDNCIVYIQARSATLFVSTCGSSRTTTTTKSATDTQLTASVVRTASLIPRTVRQCEVVRCDVYCGDSGIEHVHKHFVRRHGCSEVDADGNGLRHTRTH